MKIVKTGFELLGISKRQIDTTNFEVFYKCSFPPILKVFFNTFNIARGGLSDVTVYIPLENKDFNILELKYIGNHKEIIGLYDLVSISESIESMENAYNNDDEIFNQNLAYIGDCMDNMSLMVGVGEENKDRIYIECTELFHTGERIILVAENIFEFIKNLVLVEKANPGYGISDYKSLYRNWGENFWRIKG